jgi:hypothetical protein
MAVNAQLTVARFDSSGIWGQTTLSIKEQKIAA